MRAFAGIMVAATIAGTLLPCQKSSADLMLMTIRTVEQCPEGLTVQSKSGSDGLIEFDVSLDAEEVAHADEMYRGRVKANAYLKIGTAEQQVASVTVQGATEGKLTHYRFRLSPAAAETSELQLAVSLYEKGGRPTFGGGVSLQVHLAGFEPTMKAGEAEAKP